MRVLVGCAAICAAFLAGVLTAGASSSAQQSAGLPPGPSTIHATAHLEAIEHDGETVVRLYRLLNRPAYPRPIGSAILECQPIAAELACHEYLKLSRGQIVAAGVVDRIAFYRLGITGGTGYYDAVGGSLLVESIGDGTQTIVAQLEGF